MAVFGFIMFGFLFFVAIVLVPVVIALELMVCNLSTRKLLRVIPVIVGAVLTYPVARLWSVAYLMGVSMYWWVLSAGIVLSLACSGIGWYIQRKMK